MGLRYTLYGRVGLFCLAVAAVFPFFSVSAWTADLQLVEAVVCRAVEDREPVDAATEFPATVGKIFCYTRLEAASYPAQIAHLWYYQDKLVHEYILPVHAARWRTWSSKNIFSDMTGSWRVDIVDTSLQTVLGSVSFRIH